MELSQIELDFKRLLTDFQPIFLSSYFDISNLLY